MGMSWDENKSLSVFRMDVKDIIMSCPDIYAFYNFLNDKTNKTKKVITAHVS